MKKIAISIIVLLLGCISYSYAGQTNISFTILGTGSDIPVDTGTVDTGGSGGGGGSTSTGFGGGVIPSDEGGKLGSATGQVAVIVPDTGEFPTVYAWGHHYGLIDKESQLYDTIDRVEFARIMTLFIQNVRSQQIESNPKCILTNYADYAKIYKGDRPYVKTTCDIGLMGWNGDRTDLMIKYNPYQVVTRDQMATIFSRMLYGTTYDNSDASDRYKDHLYAIYKAGLITKPNPAIVESRINILIILQRIATVLPHGTVKPYGGTSPSVATGVAHVTSGYVDTGSLELQEAYNRAKENDITTIPSYNEKSLYSPIMRGELARMLVVFSKATLGKEVGNRAQCTIENYTDYSRISNSLRPYVQDACDLTIMGVTTTGELIGEFRPYDTVTRAEFATVLSRILYGPLYDTNNSEDRYLPHLKALSNAGYIHTIDTPFMKELNGYILLILKRISATFPHL